MYRARTAFCIRTHRTVTPQLISLARRLSENTEFSIIFAINTESQFPGVEGFDVITVNQKKIEDLGLSHVNGIFWRCGDYFLYVVQNEMPDFDYYWLMEDDVLINHAEPDALLAHIDTASDADFLSSYMREAEDYWDWQAFMRPYADKVYRSFFPLIRLSGRALTFLHAERQRALAIALTDKGFDGAHWPNDESFTATVLANSPYFTTQDFNDIIHVYDEQGFYSGIIMHPMEIGPVDGLIYHPVRRGDHYIEAVAIRRSHPKLQFLIDRMGEEWSDKTPRLDEAFHQCFLSIFSKLSDTPENFANYAIIRLSNFNRVAIACQGLITCLASLRMYRSLDYLRENRHDPQYIDHFLLDNIALGKPAWQSSTCYWSHMSSPRLDAEGGNNGLTKIDYGFHTDQEESPWWSVDLLQNCAVRNVTVYNRTIYSERIGRFLVESSNDGANWNIVHEMDLSDPDHAHRNIKILIDFNDTVVARYLRVRSMQTGVLHAREIAVFGAVYSEKHLVDSTIVSGQSETSRHRGLWRHLFGTKT